MSYHRLSNNVSVAAAAVKQHAERSCLLLINALGSKPETHQPSLLGTLPARNQAPNLAQGCERRAPLTEDCRRDGKLARG